MKFQPLLQRTIGYAAVTGWLISLLSHSINDAAWSTSGRHDGAGAREWMSNWLGTVGAYVSDISLYLAGWSVLIIPIVLALYWLRPASRPQQGAWAFILGSLLLASMMEWLVGHNVDAALPSGAGGLLGAWLASAVLKGLPWMMHHQATLVLVLLIGLLALLQWTLSFRWTNVARSIGEALEDLRNAKRKKEEAILDASLGEQAAREREVQVLHDRVASSQLHEPDFVPSGESALVAAGGVVATTPTAALSTLAVQKPKPAPISKRVVRESQHTLFVDESTRRLPRVDLLDPPLLKQESVSTQTLEMTSRLIEKKLKDFGVEVRVIAAMPGPVVTRYEIEPATGVKGSQIVGLAKDLARSLSLVSIRVIETIPGKNCMALELPNAKRQMIKLSEILGANAYNDAKSLLTMGLGKDIAGQPVVADLAKMPHCLVAGTTGSGKSVGINAMILSLLYKAEPHEVRLLLIDPKMLEMSIYEGIPHLIAPVVTDMRQAAHGLNWCVAEMERRYKLMSKMGVRNLVGFNSKITEAKERGELIPNPFALNVAEPEPLETLPHIVIVIDELADLMMVIGKKIEELIARLAQKARAAGIHLILATQRPSVDVITGLIKANIPTRIAFQVSSKIDSRTILDQMGAEALLGMGDMLYMPSGTGFPTRVHGAFVSDEEVHRVVDYLKAHGEANYIDGVLEGGEAEGDSLDSLMGHGAGAGGGAGGGSEKDALYDQAVDIVLKNRKASISLVQRHLKIGYNRAANILEAMEKAGLVSNLSSSGQREILVPNRSE
ncbi:MAG: DNA translocase FtsK 4TM domain-containing protein [Cytophagales bacterium]|nr:DNA translocase FtsK 4TM domain-containing protein [Cytophagales bacterium]